MSGERPVLATSASRGRRRDTLVRLRDVVAWSVDHSDSPRDIATLGRLMVTVLDEIEQCTPAKKTTKGATGLSEFQRRLKKRQDQVGAAG